MGTPRFILNDLVQWVVNAPSTVPLTPSGGAATSLIVCDPRQLDWSNCRPGHCFGDKLIGIMCVLVLSPIIAASRSVCCNSATALLSSFSTPSGINSMTAHTLPICAASMPISANSAPFCSAIGQFCSGVVLICSARGTRFFERPLCFPLEPLKDVMTSARRSLVHPSSGFVS